MSILPFKVNKIFTTTAFSYKNCPYKLPVNAFESIKF